MSEAVVAKRYAEALFRIGNEKATLDQMVEDFQVVKEVFQTNKKLNTFLKHPRINNVKKKQFLADVFQGLGTDVITTLKLLVDRHRTDIIPSMIDHFNQFVNDAKGIAEVTVYSVRKLSNPERSQLVASLVKRFSKSTFEINNVIDPTLIGGVKVRIGNTIIDGSISRKLQRIERDIVTANK